MHFQENDPAGYKNKKITLKQIRGTFN
jgi:hypothetical protein